MLPLHHLLSLLAAFLLAVSAQSSQSSSSHSGLNSDSSSSRSADAAATTASSNVSSLVITTTILSALPTSSGQPQAQTTTFVLTLTLNSSATQTLSPNSTTVTNSSSSNTTLQANETAAAWNSSMDYLPFKIEIDPAYGVLGGLLIITGIPVAALGGRNRWSSLAIVSGYTFMLFTLVMILRFGVTPALQPPSPKPPSRTLRGLYLLAGIFAAFIGSGIGIFFWKYAQYWVCPAGGFAFAWFIMATKPDGVVTSTVARWGLIGGITLGAFVAGLHPKITPFMVLAGTAWIGATAFTLGVDCFTRAGLKEFYIYNLGFHSLFPKLGDDKYPLTQTMQVELGVLGAVVLIGAAIQFKVLNMLQVKMKQMRDLEAAKQEAEEEAKAAERLKDVSAELTDWEAKYGNGSSGQSTLGATTVQHLDFSDGRPSSSASLLGPFGGRVETLALEGIPTREHLPLMELGARSLSPVPLSTGVAGSGPTNPELEAQMKLLADVQRVRRDVRGSLDQLRAGTPPTTLEPHSRQVSVSSARLLDTPGTSSTPSPTMGVAPSKSEWEVYLQERKLVTPPSGITPRIPTTAMPGSRRSEYVVVSEGVAHALNRRQRTMSAFELGDGGATTDWGARGRNPATMPLSTAAAPFKERVVATDGDSPIQPHFPSRPPLTPPVIIGHAKPPPELKPAPPQRTLTYDELDARHRRTLSKLQEPITSKMKEEVDVAEARDKWAKISRLERDEMKRRERDRIDRAAERERHGGGEETAHRKAVLPHVPTVSATRKTDEWRRSVSTGLDTPAPPLTRQPPSRPEAHRHPKGPIN